VLLFGDPTARPDGLERALVRAGFSLAEGPAVDVTPTPDLALVAVHDAGPTLERALLSFSGDGWTEVPVIVLLANAERDGIARALSLGAADAMAAPIDLAELGARLEARLRARAEVRRAAGAGSLQSELFLAVEEIAEAQRPDEMLETLVRRLGQALGAAHCVCLVPSSDRRSARLVAVHENPTLRDVQVDLARYPEAVEALVSGRTVHAEEVLRHPLFLSHLARWPDSPEVHEIESAAAVAGRRPLYACAIEDRISPQRDGAVAGHTRLLPLCRRQISGRRGQACRSLPRFYPACRRADCARPVVR
jgi:DNA-binding response OmpR family regulator